MWPDLPLTKEEYPTIFWRAAGIQSRVETGCLETEAMTSHLNVRLSNQCTSGKPGVFTLVMESYHEIELGDSIENVLPTIAITLVKSDVSVH